MIYVHWVVIFTLICQIKIYKHSHLQTSISPWHMSFLDITTSLFLGGKFHTIPKFWKFLCHKKSMIFFKRKSQKVEENMKKILRKISTFLYMVQVGSQWYRRMFSFFSSHIFLIVIFGSIGLWMIPTSVSYIKIGGKKWEKKKNPPQIEHNYWVAIIISVLIHLISFRYLINTHYNISLCNFLEVYLNLHERVERMWEMLTNFCANYMNGLGGHMEGQIMQMYSTR